MGDVPHRRAACDARGCLPGVRQGGDRRGVDGRAGSHRVCRATPRAVCRRGVVERSHAYPHLPDPGGGAYQSQIRGQGEDPDALWGDPVTNVDVWRAHNPYDLAPKLKGIPIYLACGNGDPGPLDLPGVERNGNEAALELENVALAKRFSELGIPADVHLYGPGTHAWPYWQREMHQAWPMFVTALGL